MADQGCILPLELIYIVFRHLHDDKAAMSACSLVCLAWLSPAQSYLYRSVSITIKPSLERTDPLTQTDLTSVTDSDIQVLLHLLQQSPHLSRFIQHLRIGGETASCYVTGELIPLLKELQTLQKLHLENLMVAGFGTLLSSYITCNTDPLPQFSLFFPSIRTIEICDTCWDTDVNFVLFLSLFPWLQELKLLRIDCLEDILTPLLLGDERSSTGASAIEYPKKPQISSLILKDRCVEFLYLFAPFMKQIDLLHCELRDNVWESPYQVSQTLKATSCFVTNLALNVGEINFNETNYPELCQLLRMALPSFSSLKTFRIDIFNAFEENVSLPGGIKRLDSDQQWSFAIYCFEVLSGGPSACVTLENITIANIGFVDQELQPLSICKRVVSSLTWQGLGAALQKLRSLNNFTLIVGLGEETVWQEVVTRNLPWLQTRLTIIEENLPM